MSRNTQRRPGTTALAAATVIALIVAACSSDDNESGDTAPASAAPVETEPAETEPVDTEPVDTEPVDTEAPDSTASTEPAAPAITEDRAYYILPPGNYGGLPKTDESTDQLALYDSLTPLRDDVSDADIDELFLPEDFEPIGETIEEDTGRPGTTVVYDEFGVPHITGETREDMAFGAGWVAARDRSLLYTLAIGPSRAAVADVPGIDPFGLVTSGQSFTPSAAAEQLVTDQVQLIIDTYGEEGEEIISDAQAYADGLNAYWAANDVAQPEATVNDVIAITSFIGSIFGAGGGSEGRNAEFLSALQNELGEEQGRQVFLDLMPDSDPEAPKTIEETFDYPALTGGDVTGSVTIDAGSLVSVDLLPEDETAPEVEGRVTYTAADGPPSRRASNWLMVEPESSANDTTLAVMGPQLGYYYPEIVQQVHLSAPGIEAQGAAVPGLSMYLLLGRTEDYAWSLTSASQDVRDVFVEMLCEPDGSEPTVESQHYEFEGECTPFESFDAGVLGDVPIVYPVSVHGPVIATATSDGAPVALTSQRSTFGRDGLNLAALKNMTEGEADTADSFFEIANQFGFTFNWGYANREGTAYFASGRLPVRAEGLDRRLPTSGTGEYEWQGFLEQDEHPHAAGHPTGRLLNWNNQSAPGFMHGDGTQYGSVHRVEAFDQWPDQSELTDVVGIMNRSATEDPSSTVWPVISQLLSGSESAPTQLSAEAVRILDEWVLDDAPILDADDDGLNDSPGPTIFGAVFDPIVGAVGASVLGEELTFDRQGIDDASFVDKDLRALLGEQVDGPFEVAYCAEGDLAVCREAVWTAIDDAVTELAEERGDDPMTWLDEGPRTTFVPGLIDDDFRYTSRPTFQQVLELAPAG
ncbi:penicillin acylase family protein [Ilumatobacter nonamiensis]|uniref:penicillin acylase family protein n=1 Tax=Ilumatobacter nonamiensis TaxID=467093 RepID=UPI00034DD36F|nr:penicillin acylase family protein [Ilumatobacter nonamiensis]